MHFLTAPITAIGNLVLWFLEFLGGLGYLLRDTFFSVHQALFISRGRRMGWANLWAQMVRVGASGGMIVGRVFLGIGLLQYVTHTFDVVKLQDFVTGLIKSGVFGTLISGLACFLGLNVTGGAQGVGAATTRTVVLTIVALIIVDLFFTGAFYYLGF